MADDSSPSTLPSKIDRNYGNRSNTDEVVVVVPAQGAAGVLRKEKASKQPLNIEIAVESRAEEENMKKQRRRRVRDDKGVMSALE